MKGTGKMKAVVVIGGGITGLATLHYLKKQMKAKNKEAKLILIEKNTYLGGKIRSVYEDGFIIEEGADSIEAGHPDVLEFITDLDFKSEIVYNDTGTSYIHTNNELHAIPSDSTYGIPMNVESLMASTLISEEAKKRFLQDEKMENLKFTKESSIGAFLEYFLGEEIVRKQIAPLLACVYSGDLYQLSLASTLPSLLDYKNEYGSIMKGLEANQSQYDRQAEKKFISFRNGLSAIIDRLEETLIEDVTIKKGVAIMALGKRGDQYRIELDTGEHLEADVVVLAVPNETVKKIIENDVLAHLFDQFTTGSAITMYLGYNIPDDGLPADGTGFIVSHNSDLVCNASTWTSRKWKHTSKDGNLLVRLCYKNSNARYDELAKMSDLELARVAYEDIRLSLGITEAPTILKTIKWTNQIPLYDKAHKDALIHVMQLINMKFPDIHLAGSSYFGDGIGACIANAKATAKKVVKTL